MLINFIDATNDANHYTKPPPKNQAATKGEGIPQISDMHFQIALTSVPSIWPDMVEFRSASSGIRGRIKKKKEGRRRRRILGKT